MNTKEKCGAVVIAGAGPAGLSAAYHLATHGVTSVVLEQSQACGGLSRTEEYRGYRFDIGGHRFFTHVSLIARMWREILGDEFLVRPRLSRVYHRGRFFRYPLEPFDALVQLGPVEAILCLASYVRSQLFPPASQQDLESWLIARFGSRLYRLFFESYTEKVWGTPCRSIAADWAAQRIRGLSLKTIAEQIIRRWFKRPGVEPKTLIAEFEYPRLGPGQMWTTVQRKIEESGASVRFGSQVHAIHWEPGRVVAFEAGGRQHAGRHFISSMPIPNLLRALRPQPPEDTLRAADDFHYRDFITVALIVRERDLFPDTWIYIHDPAVKVGRIQNYKNWSPDMVPNPETTCLGFEYFCFEGDDLWNAPDHELIERAKRELEYLGLGKSHQVADGVVLRVPKAYPVYDGTYQRGLGIVRRFLETVPNLQLIGRNGMHRYNNQDHSMLTGILAARNLLGLGKHDLWEVNADEEYHEDGFLLSHEETERLALSQPLTPTLVSSATAGRG